MFFVSTSFLCFFLVFSLLYWKAAKQIPKSQNLILLIGCYFFYALLDWKFLALLLFNCVFNYYLGIFIAKTTRPGYRRLLVFIGLLEGIGLLIFFKYFNFFITNLNELCHLLGFHSNLKTLHLILPLGISFYTFRVISYLLDIDKGKIQPTTSFTTFGCYVSFFPSIIAGPIDKAQLLIPQLEKPRVFKTDEMKDASKQVLWGLFKKLVVADGCAPLAEHVFDNYTNMPGSSLLLGVFFYAIQMYADFSGYSDMAIGLAKMIGFNTTRNFANPFFSQNIAEYWRKWHMSLTNWLTEYIYTPCSIQFRYYGNAGVILAIIINFIFVGLWHGANWTYVAFGLLHSIYFIPLILRGKMNKKKEIKGNIPTLGEAANIIGTFSLVLLAFVFFRAETVTQAFQYLSHLFSPSLFSAPEVRSRSGTLLSLIFIFILFTTEWFNRTRQYGLQQIGIKNRMLRWGFYYILLLLIFYFDNSGNSKFIYAQY